MTSITSAIRRMYGKLSRVGSARSTCEASRPWSSNVRSLPSETTRSVIRRAGAGVPGARRAGPADAAAGVQQRLAQHAALVGQQRQPRALVGQQDAPLDLAGDVAGRGGDARGEFGGGLGVADLT